MMLPYLANGYNCQHHLWTCTGVFPRLESFPNLSHYIFFSQGNLVLLLLCSISAVPACAPVSICYVLRQASSLPCMLYSRTHKCCNFFDMQYVIQHNSSASMGDDDSVVRAMASVMLADEMPLHSVGLIYVMCDVANDCSIWKLHLD